MKIIKKLLLLALPLVVFAQTPTVKQLFNVQTIKVKKEIISERIKNYGYAAIDQTRIYDIVPRFNGYVINLDADKIYKKVKKGEPLAVVYSPEVFKAKDEYLNTYRYSKKRSDKSMLESAKLKLKLLGVVDKEIKEIIKNEKASPYTTIYAPVSGYIFIKNIEKGSAFKAKQQLFQIVNLDKVWVEVKLFEEQRELLSSIFGYEISFKGLDKVYKTKKQFLYPQLNPDVATLTLRLQVENKSNMIFPGMYANVILLKNRSEQLILPATAVIRKDGKYYVFMAGDFEGEYEPKEIKVKRINSNIYKITDGLKEGDEVVNNALFMMDSDAQINSLY